MKKFKLDFIRNSNLTAYAYFKVNAKDSERVIARVNKELDRLNRTRDSNEPWILHRIEEID